MPIGEGWDAELRQLIERALKNDDDGLIQLIGTAQEYERVASLAVQSAAHIVIDTCDRWPTDADLKEVARLAGNSSVKGIGNSDLADYLKRCVFGAEKITGVFGDKAATVPVTALAALLVSFRPPEGTGWNHYLDIIEAGIEAAEKIRETDLPSIMYRFQTGK